MQAVKIKIGGSSFLLPISHSDNYDFPTYITNHKADVIKCIEAYKEWLKNPLQDMPPMPDMEEFKQKTGIIGVPFNLHDVDLYVLDRKVDIVSEIEL